jgi:hypothetical protein
LVYHQNQTLSIYGNQWLVKGCLKISTYFYIFIKKTEVFNL